ncbi:MAG: hypothetical protein J6X61_01670, partial [Clostridia bacterium]|nr:hypothetical protein [Clostridia bacterium]
MGEFDKYKGQIPDDLFEEEETASAGPAPEEPAAAPERDEFVIGSGFNLGTDYEARVRRRRGMDQPPVVKKQEVDLRKIKKEQRREEKKKKTAKYRWLRVLIWLAVIFAVAGISAYGLFVVVNDVFGLSAPVGIYQVVIDPGMTTTQIADRL